LFDDWQSVLALVAAILIAYGVILTIGMVVWTYRDIRERTRDNWSQTVAVLLVAILNIPGLVLYLILRPRETLIEAYERRLEAEALMRELPDEPRSCPSCARAVSEDFLLCPYCRTRLRTPCSGCGRALELVWSACPYCAADGPHATTPVTRPVAAYSAPAAGPPVPESPAPQPAATSTPQQQEQRGGRPGPGQRRRRGGGAPPSQPQQDGSSQASSNPAWPQAESSQ
jgi:RNA polymerase subunit RPABC4/transcription elongation factor Spt4